MKPSDINSLGEDMYELEKGHGDRRLGKGDIAELQFGGIETEFVTLKLMESADIFLPSPLDEDKLISLSVTHDGSYKDNTGRQQRLSPLLRAVIPTMTIGQKVMILKKEGNDQNEKQRMGGSMFIIKLVNVRVVNRYGWRNLLSNLCNLWRILFLLPGNLLNLIR